MGKKKHSQQLDLAPSKTAPNAGSPGRVSPASPSEGAICGIYGIYCVADERWYVGQSVDIHRRWRAHFRAVEAGRHDNSFFQAAVHKYGWGEFLWVVLEVVPKKNLDSAEIVWMAQLGAASPGGFNLVPGGKRIPLAWVPYVAEKLSKARKGVKWSAHTLRIRGRAVSEACRRRHRAKMEALGYTEDYQQCRICGKVKRLALFSAASRGTLRVSSWCKACTAKRARDRRARLTSG